MNNPRREKREYSVKCRKCGSQVKIVVYGKTDEPSEEFLEDQHALLAYINTLKRITESLEVEYKKRYSEKSN